MLPWRQGEPPQGTGPVPGLKPGVFLQWSYTAGAKPGPALNKLLVVPLTRPGICGVRNSYLASTFHTF